MSHDRDAFELQLSELLDGRLAEDEARAVREHLDSCDECRARYAELTGAMEVLRATPRPPVPPGLLQEIQRTAALEMAARTEHQAAQDKLAKILAETESLEAEARALHKKLPVIAASERSIDPDLLEEELLIVSGREPGSGDDLATERKFAELEKKSSADDALERLKASMGMAAGGGPVGSPDPQSGTGDSSKRS